MSVEKLVANIEKGSRGENVGISTGLPVIDSIIFGIQKGYLYTVGADSSGGKTSFAIDIFVYNLLKNNKEHPISILYYSFEISGDVLFAKLLSRHIWDKYQEIITYEDILSLTAPISPAHKKLVDESIPWLNELSTHLTIYDKSLSPAAIYATCKQWLKRFGTFEEVGEHRETYTEDDPKRYKIVLTDHVALISGAGSKKERIDTVVDYMVYFRNKCNISGIFIQQMNRNSKSMERKTNGYELYQLDDFKDTSGTTDASEVVIALYYPYREKIARCEGYPIQNILKRRFRLAQILKNRYGQADVNKGIVFYGEIGMFAELPKPEQIADYEPYLDLNYQKKKEDSGENENIFKF